MAGKHTHDRSALDRDAPSLSIGAVSKATGIPTETLRTWERRYGFPSPQRTDSGHRKYTEQTVERLRRANLALKQGMRPADVLTKSFEELSALLDLTQSAGQLDALPPCPHPVSALRDDEPALSESAARRVVESWLQRLLELNEEALRESFELNWYRLGPLSFLTHLIAPFLTAIGEEWYEGRLAVIHEQFASRQLREFLSSQWREMSQRNRGVTFVCATLPGEFHAIGLHMIATVVAVAGCRVVFLGSDAPLEAIGGVAQTSHASVVLVSVSSAAYQPESKEKIEALRALLPDTVELLIGGQGAPKEVKGVTRLGSLKALRDWASLFNRAASKKGEARR